MQNDMNYTEMVTLLKNLVQNKSANYAADVIKPLIQMISAPQIARRSFWSTITKPYSLTLTVNQDTYTLPYDFDKFYYLKNKYTEMSEITGKDYFRRLPDKTNRNANIINSYYVEEYQGVHTQPASAESITVTSDSTEDSGKVAMVRGNVNTVDDYEEVTLDASGIGITTKLFSEILYVTKDGVSTGRYVVTGTSSTTELAQLAPEHRTTYYKRMILDSFPTEALVLSGAYVSNVYRPQRDYDVFRIPADLVLLSALYYMQFERREIQKSQLMKSTLDDEIIIAINRDEKNLNIESQMELANPNRGVIQDDHPLFYSV